jgi:hypothetical protein
MDAKSRRRLSSGLSGFATGAGSGAEIGSMIAPGIGTAIGAGAGALLGGIGGALTPDEPQGPSPEELALKQQEINNQNNQFNLEFGQKKLNDNKTWGFEGLKALAAQRQSAMANLRRYNFRNDLLAAAGGK